MEYVKRPSPADIRIRIIGDKSFFISLLKINAVAEHCGFSNQYHFCRLFKEKTGLTPTEYMKQNRIYKI